MKGIKTVTIVMAVVVSLSLVPLMGASEVADADAVDGPTIAEAGYAETQESLFYLAKFGMYLFPYTGGSASNDTPVAGVGLNMTDDTLFASVVGLDVDSDYYIFIEEYPEGSDEPAAQVCISLGSGAINRGVWISVIGGFAYVDGAEAESDFRTGAFSGSVDGSSFVFYLVEESGASVSTATLDDVLSQKELTDAGSYSLIVDHGVYVSDEADLVQYFGNRYGFSSSGAVRYAGAESDYVAGEYLCMILFTNLTDPTIVVTSGGSSYTVPADDIYNGNSATDEGAVGYALVVVPLDDMASVGISSLESYTIEVGDGANVYASVSSEASGGDSGDNTLAIAAVAVVAVILIIIVAVWYMRSAKAGE